MPTGDVLNYLYYGSGHLHHINLNGETLTDIERDNLHRPIVRSAGQLNTQFQFDPMGRLKQQISQLAQYDSSNQSALIERQYHYDATGNLIRTDDQRNGNIDYVYDSLGRILQAADERFAFDPAHNISDDAQIIKGNRLAEYNGVRYRYDGLGNLIERHSYTESQFYRYDADNQLIEAHIEKANSPTQYWQYRYDPFGRRISKTNAKTQQSTLFVWEGSRLLQELRQDKVYTYVYTEQNSYEPLAQIEVFRQPEKLNTPIIRYFHTDQIGIPREMTDEAGNIIWRGQYSAWGKLTEEEKANPSIHQPFRLQNQYADEETGLHYNFFRYYDAHCGRFTQQDPIKLAGGENFYAFALNVQGFIDPLGLVNFSQSYSQVGQEYNSKCSNRFRNLYYQRPSPNTIKTKSLICNVYRKNYGDIDLSHQELFDLRQRKEPEYARDDNIAAAERFYEMYLGTYVGKEDGFLQYLDSYTGQWVILTGDQLLKLSRTIFLCERGNASMYGLFVNSWGLVGASLRSNNIRIKDFCNGY